MPHAGELNPTVPVAHALRARGHEVAYLINADLEAGLRAEGLRCIVGPGGIYGRLGPPPPGPGAAVEARPAEPLGPPPPGPGAAVEARPAEPLEPPSMRAPADGTVGACRPSGQEGRAGPGRAGPGRTGGIGYASVFE